MTRKSITEEHVGELLSGYLDGELTQQDRQRVRLHCDSCAECESSLGELEQLRQRIGQASLSGLSRHTWRETMDDTGVKATRGVGWLLLLGGALLGVGVGIYEIITNPAGLSFTEKLIVGGLYGGILLLFISVVRQRLLERKSDRYKDVEI